MENLYNLTSKYETVLNMLYDEDIDEQMVLDTLESIEGEIEDKADSYAMIIKEMLSDAEACKQEKIRLENRQKSFENRAKLLKDRLEEVMKETGKMKFKTQLFSFNIQKNGGLAPLWIIEDIKQIPEEYLRKEPDNTKIRQLLSTQEVEWARLEERGESLRIR